MLFSQSLGVLAATAGIVGQVNAYSTNYTPQLLSSGTIKLGQWENAYNQAKTLVDGLTDAQKVSIITGSDISNFTALYQRDSGNSILDYYWTTAWPLSSALAMTWDKSMFYSQYNALASEFRAKGINMMKGPVSEPLGRTPWGGRNGESFGPDSYLNGIATGLAVRAAGDKGVISCAKHFLLNEQENNRTVSSVGDPGSSGSSSANSVAYSAQVDDKTLHETYMAPFYDAVKNGLGAAMCALNRVNLTYACENQDLLAKELKTEIGFPGLILGDVGGQKTAFGSANAGLDFGDANYWSNDTILAGIKNGSLTEARLNDMAVRNVMPYYYFNQQNGYPSTADLEDYVDARGNHSALARQIAAASLVLLKNEGALPLSRPRSMSIFGAHAGAIVAGPNNEISVVGSADVYQGHAAGLGGSGEQSYAYLVTPWYSLTTKVMQDGTQFRWIMNNTGYESSSGGAAGYSSGTGATKTYESYASDSEVCICFLNAYSGEGGDRSELTDSDLDSMVTSVASSCNNTIVVLNTVAPRLVDAWIENENVTALVYGSMLGEQSGNAIVDVLYGDVNPSGKLTYTIAKNESDYNTKLCDTAVCDFSEGNYIDYKYFDKYNVTPRYEYGFGLSYTNFTYDTELTVSSNSSLKSGPATGVRAVGGREDLWDIVGTASIKITNSGSRTGAEVVQLYVSFPDVAGQPLRQLRGFDKLELQAGETGTAEFELRRRDLSYWDVTQANWIIANGTYTLYAAASSRDLKAQATIAVV